jgi:hypothetical protein
MITLHNVQLSLAQQSELITEIIRLMKDRYAECPHVDWPEVTIVKKGREGSGNFEVAKLVVEFLVCDVDRADAGTVYTCLDGHVGDFEFVDFRPFAFTGDIKASLGKVCTELQKELDTLFRVTVAAIAADHQKEATHFLWMKKECTLR